MKCPECKRDNIAGSIYCEGCGSEIITPATKTSKIEVQPTVPLRLVVTKGANKGRVFSLEPGFNLVGRWDPDAGAFPEIDLEAEDIEAKVSRKHAVIEVAENGVFIEDAGSLNGTFINRGPRLEAGAKYQLRPGDELIIGKTFLSFEQD